MDSKKAIVLNLSQAQQLVDMFGECSDTEICLIAGPGHAGPGVYAYYDEYPEEGSALLEPEEPVQEDVAQLALFEAVSALYFNDSSDYEAYFWKIIKHLAPRSLELMRSNPKAVYDIIKGRIYDGL